MVTLTGTFTRLDGDPATGTVRVTPSRSPIMDPDGKIVISGPQTFPLDKDGKLTTEIPASNDPDLGPAFTYSIDVNLTHASWKISKVWIPHGSTTVDLSEISDYQPVPGTPTRVVTIPADGTDGQVLVWDGAGFSWADAPEGPKGDPGGYRLDTTVGTRVYVTLPEGADGPMLFGDTGWRDVQNLLVNGWTGEVRIRRVNNLVTLYLRYASAARALDGTNATSASFLPIPQGFNPGLLNSENIGFIQAHIGTETVRLHVQHKDGAWHFATNGRGIYQGRVSFFVDDSWPTTLPGLPA